MKGRNMEQVYSDPSRAADSYHLPDCIVFETPDGWFWQSQMPGCLPDSDPIGDSPSKNDWNSEEPITEAISERLLTLRSERFKVPFVVAYRTALLGPEERFKFGAVISVFA